MGISVFDIFKIGIGPSSSHTMGPMNAARQFALDLEDANELESVHQVSVQLYGSLALTGKGHCTDRAVLLGLEGEEPARVDPQTIEPSLARIRDQGRLNLLGKREIDFDEPLNLLFHKDQVLPGHANGMRFSALDKNENMIRQEEFYSIGGGFIIRGDGAPVEQGDSVSVELPYPFDSGNELLCQCKDNGFQVHQLMMENEKVWRGEDDVRAGLLEIWNVMQSCVQRGFEQEGVLPGVLEVKRRAPKMYRDLSSHNENEPMDVMDWVNAFALSVNEENAAGGKVVTAPTNGAAGIVPSVMHFYMKFIDDADQEGILRFLLAAGAIATLYKKNASISGAEMGCQGEVGVACSMAAAGLMSACGGTPDQIENAAEIGMEHNLGLTCDPIAGLVQIPCIERNAMGSVKAINAYRMAKRGDGTHKVSLDQVIATMRQTGLDMSTRYKETSLGGLAVNVIEC